MCTHHSNLQPWQLLAGCFNDVYDGMGHRHEIDLMLKKDPTHIHNFTNVCYEPTLPGSDESVVVTASTPAF